MFSEVTTYQSQEKKKQKKKPAATGNFVFYWKYLVKHLTTEEAVNNLKASQFAQKRFHIFLKLTTKYCLLRRGILAASKPKPDRHKCKYSIWST